VILHLTTLNDTHTFSRTFLDQVPARRRDLYLTAHNNYNRQISMLPAGFEPAIPAFERPQIYALDVLVLGSDSHFYKVIFQNMNSGRNTKVEKRNPSA
jgi:hypothetical protein